MLASESEHAHIHDKNFNIGLLSPRTTVARIMHKVGNPFH